MIKKISIYLILILNIIFCGTAYATNLEDKVNSVLKTQFSSGSYTVASHKQNILLAGQVPSEEMRIQTSKAVQNIIGGGTLWNYLQVRENENAAEISADGIITSEAKTRLILQKNVNTNNIKVVTCANVVYLLGSNAGTTYQIKGAIHGIKNIAGVKGVVNLINK
ncbi:MAG: BON domain-containing protein [Proteobacteria bacterium]|jgi:osmotically-inducible protein OsmY|nr:BON domain-containing protein [Pseudomonadota bacterium]